MYCSHNFRSACGKLGTTMIAPNHVQQLATVVLVNKSNKFRYQNRLTETKKFQHTKIYTSLL